MSTNFFNKLKNKILTVLLVLCLVSTCALGLIACGKDNTEQDPTYTFTQSTTTDTNENNYNFSDGINLETDVFPANGTSWSVSVDNSAISSTVSSGVVNVSEEGWKKVVNALSEDQEFLDYVKQDKNQKDADNDTAKALINKDGYFVAPKREGSNDNYVYMLNNYREKTYKGVGTAQKVVSSNTTTLEKNSVYKIGVWVNTYNLKSNNPNIDDGAGANIRLVNTFNGTSQADYVINNINTNGKWKQYFMYVRSDETYNCTLSVVLGLGFGNGASTLTKDYVEGTVYFDDVTFEKIEETDLPQSIETLSLSFGAKERYAFNNVQNSLYIMEFDNTLASFLNSSVTDYKNYGSTDELFTKAVGGAITSKDLCGKDENQEYISKITADNTNADSIIFTLNKASATYRLPVSVTLNQEEYAVVNFRIKNELSNFGSTDITIDVWDIYSGLRIKRPAVATFSTPSEEFVNCTLYIKNNFKDIGGRTFEIDFIMGPTKVADVDRANDFSSGTVTIQNLRYTSGAIEDVKDNEVAEFFTSMPSATVSLYAGFSADFDEASEEKTYSLNEAPGSIGTILSYPSNPAGYDGIVYNHAYVSDSKNVSINTRSGEDGTAGLINSQYIRDNSADYGVTLDDLGNPEKDIQPLMINNTSADSYGFVAKTSTTISASALASFTVKVRVDGANAKAFIYLVNTERTGKDVLSFEDFTVNTNVVKGVNPKTEIDGSQRLFAIEVTESMCNDDGWATVSFYIVNGKDDRQVRLELWNGSRDGEVKSQGLVFFDEVVVTSSSAFTKSEKWNETFSVSGNPLYDQTFASYDNGELLAFKRTLTEDEANFNEEYPDQAVEYYTTYVWAKNSVSVFADYSTLDSTKVIKNPYDDIEESEDEESGCAAKSDPSTFWLSFSTIILIVALALAFIALITKSIVRRRKANASDAKSHYTVTSRIKKKVNENKPVTKEEVKEETTTVEDETKPNDEETENVETTETQEDDIKNEETVETTEETDGYVYGDVIEDFTIETPETATEDDKPEDNENK